MTTAAPDTLAPPAHGDGHAIPTAAPTVSTTRRPDDPAPERPVPVTVARGDGIGPEITDAVLRILDAAGAPLHYDFVEVGEAVYRRGITSGIPPEAWDAIRRNGVFLKGPITTPQGGGYKSLNVTIRKALSLFANVRPTRSYTPYVASAHDDIDLVIVRENEEDLYAGIEHQQTPEVTQILKLVTRPGSERIIRYAFDYARAHGRQKVTCMTKDNIQKHTDGLFHRVFDEVAAAYPDIEAEHHIIDIGAARLAADPEAFDVIVTLNLYGDILSDIASQVAGSVGLAGSANIGREVAMFEAVHGSAPDIAGQDLANPSGLLQGAIQMLMHVRAPEVAERIQNAWLCTLEDGVHTADIYRAGESAERVGTTAFADAVIDRLGRTPAHFAPAAYRRTTPSDGPAFHLDPTPTPPTEKALVGVDVFIDWSEAGRDPDVIGHGLEDAVAETNWRLKMITNRGVKVYPDGLPETFWTDHWRCRFLPTTAPDGADAQTTTFPQVLDLLHALYDAGFDVIKTEHLYTFDGRRAYSLGQGE